MKRIVTLMMITMMACVAIHAELLSSTSFEQLTARKSLSRTLFQDMGFRTSDWDNLLATHTLVDDTIAATGLQSMRIMYPKGAYGSTESGCQVRLMIDERQEAYASYYLRFSENFTWGTTSYGGKLPGLAGGKACSGGDSCDGTNGFSARLMWRTGGRAVLYLYHMDKPEKYGEDIELFYPNGMPVFFERGKWYHIAERVKVNTDGSTYDGEVEIWVNGQPVLLRKGLRFTSNGDKVSDLYISTFHGGADDTWGPEETCYTWLDDIRLGTTYEDVAYQTCQKPELGRDRALCADENILLMPMNEEDNSSDRHYRWLKNGKLIATTQGVQATEEGAYVLVVDSNWCSRRDTVMVSSQIVMPLSGDRQLCSSSSVNLQSGVEGTSISYQWYCDGMQLLENTENIVARKPGVYKVVASSPKCKSSEATVRVLSKLLMIEDVVGEPGEPVVLKADGYSNVEWYADKELNTLLHVGSSYETEVGESPVYVYAKDGDAFEGYVGKKLLTTNAWTREITGKEWMVFTVERPLTIDSISIYPTKTLTAVIRVLDDETGIELYNKKFTNLPAGEQRLSIRLALPPGRYRMDASGTTGSLYHSHTDEDISFPYKIDGLISIDGCNLSWINAKPWYMFFYNWHVSTGNYCAAAEIEIAPWSATSESAVSSSSLRLYPKFTDGDLFIEGLPCAAQITIYSATGKKMLTKKVKQANVHFSMAEWKHGNYIVEIQTANWTRSIHVLKF